MRILIGIPSCRDHAAYENAQRNTWLKDVSGCATYRFILGHNGIPGQTGDGIYLGEDDYKPEQGLKKYPTLPTKTKLLCKYALWMGYNYLFKCDTDTLVNPENLLFSDFEDYDYSGGYNQEESGEFCSGGAGYWLSRKAMRAIANSSIAHWSEDVFVALALREKGILPHFNSGYRWKPGEVVDKSMISLHLRSARNEKTYNPIWMHETYAQMKALNDNL
jgi:hypothetical protein